MRLSDLPALQHINWNPDTGELRRFAVAMLVGFGIIGGIFAFRAGSVGTLSVALWITGCVLAASAFIPGAGRRAYLGVYVVSGLIGAVVSRVVLALMFFFVFFPLGVFLRLTGKDFLSRKPGSGMWRKTEPPDGVYSYYRQF